MGMMPEMGGDDGGGGRWARCDSLLIHVAIWGFPAYAILNFRCDLTTDSISYHHDEGDGGACPPSSPSP